MNLFFQIHRLCLEKKISLSTAESCTGGLFASKISSIPGSSSFFKGGVVAYQNSIKTDVLGVKASLINEKTEVSSEVVKQMAILSRLKFNSSFSVSFSGYAGPDGGTKLKPVGTVFIGISSAENTISKRFFFNGNRKTIVDQSINSAASFLLLELKKYK